MRLRSLRDPERDQPVGVLAQELAYDQRGLLGVSNEHTCAIFLHDDAQLGPLLGNHVDIGLEPTGRLLTKAVPGVGGVRHILRRVIATQLVLGARIRRTQIEAVIAERLLSPQAECETDEAAHVRISVGAGLSRELELDRTVGETRVIEDHDRLTAPLHALDDPYRLPAQVFDRRQLNSTWVETLEPFEWKHLVLLKRTYEKRRRKNKTGEELLDHSRTVSSGLRRTV